jgi:hypothetical protein
MLTSGGSVTLSDREASLREVLAAIHAIPDELVRAQSLTAFASYLSDTLLPDALDAARAISNEAARAQSLAALAARLPSTPVREIANFFEQRGKDAQERAHLGLILSMAGVPSG